MSFAPEKQCESAHHLVLTLSAMLASPTDGNCMLTIEFYIGLIYVLFISI